MAYNPDIPHLSAGYNPLTIHLLSSWDIQVGGRCVESHTRWRIHLADAVASHPSLKQLELNYNDLEDHPGGPQGHYIRVEGLLFLKNKMWVFMEVWNYAYVLTIPSIYVQMN